MKERKQRKARRFAREQVELTFIRRGATCYSLLDVKYVPRALSCSDRKRHFKSTMFTPFLLDSSKMTWGRQRMREGCKSKEEKKLQE